MVDRRLLKNATEICERIAVNPRKIEELVTEHGLPATFSGRSWKAVAWKVDKWLPDYLEAVGSKRSPRYLRKKRRTRR